jgi:hypothetical protein
MSIEVMKGKLNNTLRALEESGDIIITTATPNTVVDRILEDLTDNVHRVLNDEEISAVLNTLNVLSHNINLDDRDFQTVIGVDRSELNMIWDKLSSSL